MSNAMVAPKQAAEQLATQLEAARARIEMVLPPNMSADRVIGVAQNLFQRDQAIRECEPSSIVRAVVQAAELGLDSSPKLGQAYFIPRNVKVRGKENGRDVDRWVKRCELQIGFKGALAKAYESPRILSIDVELVREKDRFEIHRGTHPDVLHEYALVNRGEVIGGYCATRLGPADANPPVWRVTDMTRADIDKIRDEADSYRKYKNAKASGKNWHPPPWVEHYDEMAKKTILVRACKTLPIGDTFRKALDADADEMRSVRRAQADAPAGSTRTDDLKAKLGVTPAPAGAVDAEYEEIDPDGPEAP